MFPENISKNFDRVRQIAFSNLPMDEKMRLFEEFDKILVVDFVKNRKFYVPNCFLPIKGSEDYAINPYGDVIVNWVYDVRILSRYKSKGTVRLSSGTYDKKHRSVHILVAETFMQNPESKKCVNFKDGNRDNVRLDNLEFGTTYKKTNITRDKDSSIRRDKLSVDEIIQISEMLDAGEKDKKIAEKFNVRESTICYIYIFKKYGTKPADMNIPMHTCKPKKVKCVETGKLYSSYSEAERDLNLGRNTIRIYFNRVAVGMRTDVKGFHFERIEEGSF